MYADACKDLKIIIHVLLGLRRIRNLHSNKCLKAHHPPCSTGGDMHGKSLGWGSDSDFETWNHESKVQGSLRLLGGFLWGAVRYVNRSKCVPFIARSVCWIDLAPLKTSLTIGIEQEWIVGHGLQGLADAPISCTSNQVRMTIWGKGMVRVRVWGAIFHRPSCGGLQAYRSPGRMGLKTANDTTLQHWMCTAFQCGPEMFLPQRKAAKCSEISFVCHFPVPFCLCIAGPTGP